MEVKLIKSPEEYYKYWDGLLDCVNDYMAKSEPEFITATYILREIKSSIANPYSLAIFVVDDNKTCGFLVGSTIPVDDQRMANLNYFYLSSKARKQKVILDIKATILGWCENSFVGLEVRVIEGDKKVINLITKRLNMHPHSTIYRRDF